MSMHSTDTDSDAHLSDFIASDSDEGMDVDLSTEEVDEGSGTGIFAGHTFGIHGSQPGMTRGQIAKLLKSEGGRVMSDLSGLTAGPQKRKVDKGKGKATAKEDRATRAAREVKRLRLTHLILGGELWSRQGSKAADLLIDVLLKANEANRTPEDPNKDRVWLLPLDWVKASIEKQELQPEADYDYDRTDEEKKRERAKELAEERRQNDGKSKYAPGERRRVESEKEMQKEMAREVALERAPLRTEQAFSGLPVAVVPPPSVPSVSEDDVLSVIAQLGCDRSRAGGSNTSTLAAAASEEAESLFLAHLFTAFDSLAALDASFRPPAAGLARSFPRQSTLGRLCALVKSRVVAKEVVGDAVEALLSTPGASTNGTDGGWVVTVLEILPALTTDASQPKQRQLLSRFFTLVAALPSMVMQNVQRYLRASDYPAEAFREKVALATGFLECIVVRAIKQTAVPPNELYGKDEAIKGAAKVARYLSEANSATTRLPLSAFYISSLDALDATALCADYQSYLLPGSGFSFSRYSFLLSPKAKAKLLWAEASLVEQSCAGSSEELSLVIRREQLDADSFIQLTQYRSKLMKPLSVTLDGKPGREKEWATLVADQLFHASGMFTANSGSSKVWFNPAFAFEGDAYWLAGVLVALVLLNEIEIDLPLPRAIYRTLLSAPHTLADLAQIHPSLARELQHLLSLADAGAVARMRLKFVGEYEAWGEKVVVDLVAGGRELGVTLLNRDEYVRLLLAFHLSTSIASQVSLFKSGFREACRAKSLELFAAEELEEVLSGKADG
ncbi:hypothetical protein JCM10213_006925 [Rhodosporidiobolus nylandii]